MKWSELAKTFPVLFKLPTGTGLPRQAAAMKNWSPGQPFTGSGPGPPSGRGAGGRPGPGKLQPSQLPWSPARAPGRLRSESNDIRIRQLETSTASTGRRRQSTAAGITPGFIKTMGPARPQSLARHGSLASASGSE